MKKLFQHFIHHKKILKVTKFQSKIIYHSRVPDKNVPLSLWYIVPPPPPLPLPGANRVNSIQEFVKKILAASDLFDMLKLYNSIKGADVIHRVGRKMDDCFLQQILRRNMAWFLS